MSERLEEMLRIARAATKGPWSVDPKRSLRVMAAERATICATGSDSALQDQWQANAQHIATFNPRTAEALVKVALAAEDEIQFFPVTKELRAALSALTAAMASEGGRSPTEGLSEAKPSEEEAPDATR